MEQEKFYEDYEMGETRLTLARTITETDIVFHAGHSGDYFPHHIDVEFCKTQPFKRPIAHGSLTFTVGIGLAATFVNHRAMSYGYNKVRYPNPVFAGDTIRTKVTITSKEDHPKKQGFGTIIESKEVTNQNGDVVMFAEHVILVEKRQADSKQAPQSG